MPDSYRHLAFILTAGYHLNCFNIDTKANTLSLIPKPKLYFFETNRIKCERQGISISRVKKEKSQFLFLHAAFPVLLVNVTVGEKCFDMK